MKLFMNLRNQKINCKGSHIGVMLSFVIFFTFMFFLVIIVQPTVMKQEKQGSLDSIKSKLIEEMSSELKTASVFVDDDTEENCFTLFNFRSKTGMGQGIIVKDSEGNDVLAHVSGNNLDVDINYDVFLKVYESEEFDEATSSIGYCDSTSYYNLGLLRSDKEIFESKILALIEEYKNDLAGLKSDLSILQSNEFVFSFTYSNGTTISIGEEEIPETNIYVDESQIQYINKNALREIGFLRISVW